MTGARKFKGKHMYLDYICRSHIQQLCEIERRCWGRDAASEKDYERMFALKQTRGYVIGDDRDNLSGLVVYHYWDQQDWTGPPAINVMKLLVDIDKRGDGVGSMLMAHVCSKAEACGRIVYRDIDCRNHLACDFFEACGFMSVESPRKQEFFTRFEWRGFNKPGQPLDSMSTKWIEARAVFSRLTRKGK